MEEKYIFLLGVRCSTYNQSAYITDAMNGFVMQQTSFPYVCAIIDDASTDGEQEVIRKYLVDYFEMTDNSVAYQKEMDYGSVLFARHKTNRNCYFAVTFLKENHYSQKKTKLPYLKEWLDNVKYVALCEGDDYWTDPLKLQKQVSFLEKHSDYSLCCHRFKMYYENTDTWADDFVGEVFAKHPGAIGLDVTNAQNFRTRFTWTLTLCYRKAVADAIVWHPYKLGKRDFTFHYHLLNAGKGYCFAEYMGVYRRNDGGIWASMSLVERARFRLDGYDDFYSYHKDDPVVLECYREWVDRFYRETLLPPYSRHKLTRYGIKNLFFYFKHSCKVGTPILAMKRIVRCFGVLVGIIKA